MLQFVASDTYFVTLDLQSSSRNTSQDWSRGQELHRPKTVYETVLCALVEFPAVKWWSRWVPPPYELACREKWTPFFGPRNAEIKLGFQVLLGLCFVAA